MQVLRRGSLATVIAVGPILDNVLSAVEGLNVTVLYVSTVRPFDAATLSATTSGPTADVVLVEPYLAGTSARCVNDALRELPHRLLSLRVEDVDLRRYGSPREHEAGQGLDPAGLRRSITAFLS